MFQESAAHLLNPKKSKVRFRDTSPSCSWLVGGKEAIEVVDSVCDLMTFWWHFTSILTESICASPQGPHCMCLAALRFCRTTLSRRKPQERAWCRLKYLKLIKERFDAETEIVSIRGELWPQGHSGQRSSGRMWWQTLPMSDRLWHSFAHAWKAMANVLPDSSTASEFRCIDCLDFFNWSPWYATVHSFESVQWPLRPPEEKSASLLLHLEPALEVL